MNAGWQDPVPRGGGGMQFAMPSITPVAKVIILANVIVFVPTLLMDVFLPGGWTIVKELFGISPDTWRGWFPWMLPVWQLVTYGFLHDTSGLFHILFNMLGVYFFGSALESIVGGRRFLVTYLGGVVLGGVAMLTQGLVTGSSAVTLGASGGVLCVVVAAAVLRPETRVIFLIFPMTLRTMALIMVGLDLFNLLQSLRGFGGNTAYLAHLIGAAYGFTAVRAGWIWRDPVASWQQRVEASARERKAEDSAKVDEVLAKIHREGIQSLSAREKSLLKRVSKRR